MAEDELKLRVVLDSNGLQSQLAQLKQEVGMTIQGAISNAGGTLGTAAHAGGMALRDASSLASAVFTGPRSSDDVSLTQNALYSTFPSVTAPASTDIRRWGEHHGEQLSIRSGGYASGLYHGGMKALTELAVEETIASRAIIPAAAAGAKMLGGGSTAATAFNLFGAGTGVLGSGLTGMGFAGAAAVGVPLAIGATLVAGEAYESMFREEMTQDQARGVIKSMGKRFGASPSDEVLRGITDIQAAGRFNRDDTIGVLSAGMQFGAFGQVRGSEDFKQKFGQLMSGAKEIASTINVSMEEAVQHIAQMQGAGFGSIENAVHALRSSRITASSTGITGGEARELALAGAGMTMGTGFSASFGSAATLSNYEAVTAGLRTKAGAQGALSAETVMQMGGRARAAQVLTQHQMAHIESPLGRATMMASYDPATGELDTTQPGVYQPGAVYRKALGTLRSAENPMRALLQFHGARDRLKSEMSPEQASLGQANLALGIARMVDPTGPINEDMLVGALATRGVNPQAARAMVSQATNKDLYVERLQQQRKEAQRAEDLQNQDQRGYLEKAGDFVADSAASLMGHAANAEGQARAILTTEQTVNPMLKQAAGIYMAGKFVGEVGKTVASGLKTMTSPLVSAGHAMRRGGSALYNKMFGPDAPQSVLRAQTTLELGMGEGLGKTVSTIAERLSADEFEQRKANATAAVAQVVEDTANAGYWGGEEERDFITQNLQDFYVLAREGSSAQARVDAADRLRKEAGASEASKKMIQKFLTPTKAQEKKFKKFAGEVEQYLQAESAGVIANEALEALGGAAGDSAASRAWREFAAEEAVGGREATVTRGVERVILAAASDEKMKEGKGQVAGVLREVSSLQKMVKDAPGGMLALDKINFDKFSHLTEAELRKAAKDDVLDIGELVGQAAVELGGSRLARGAAGVATGGTAYSGVNKELRTMIEKTAMTLDGVTQLLEGLKKNKTLFPG